LPETLPGLDIERMELPPGASMTGTPHAPGTREYLLRKWGASRPPPRRPSRWGPHPPEAFRLPPARSVAHARATLSLPGERLGACERGAIELVAAGQRRALSPGDETTIAYSAVVLAPAE